MYSLLPTIGALYFAVTGIFVLLRDKTTSANLIFFFLCLTTFFWQFTWAILFQTQNPELAFELIKLGYLFILFLPTTLYHFLVKMAKRKNEEKFVYLSYGVCGLLALTLIFSDLFVKGHYEYFWGYYPKAGILHPIHVIQTMVVVTRGLYVAYSAIASSTALHKKQLQYCVASLFIYFIAAVDYLCNYGFEFYPPGIVFIIIALGIMAYSMTRYQLLDISVVLTDKLARVFALIGVGTIYIFGYFFYRKFLPQDNDLISLGLGLSFLALAAPAFMKIQKEIQTIPSRIFPKRYIYAEACEALNKRLDKIFSLNKLFSFLDNFFSVVMKVSLEEIYICNQRNEKTMIAWNIEHEKVSSSKLMSLQTLRQLKSDGTAVVYNTGDQRYRSVFQEHPSGAAVLCYEQDHLIGVFFIGLPTASIEYTYNDNRLLDKLARQVAPVLYRALAHHKVLDYLEESQKNASLVNLVNEYNHEIKGPLSILHSYATHPSLADEHTLRKLIIKQVDRTSDILDTMLNIAQGRHKRNPQPVDLNRIIKQALKLFPITFADIDLQLGQNLNRITGDKDDLHILFINLLKNTVEALHKAQVESDLDFESKITIKTRNIKDSVLIELSDSGIGIPENEIDQIWDIGYSKRNTGQGSGGIGLSVVKRIVEEHDGTIAVFNNPTQGVTFRMTFPMITIHSTQPEDTVK